MSLPMRGEWIEIKRAFWKWAIRLSLPMRGEWIEIEFVGVETLLRNGLSPCGESGLKFSCSFQSAPASDRSLPMRGEWIEMRRQVHRHPQPRLSPCGESGLKWAVPQPFKRQLRSLPMRGEWIEMLPKRECLGAVWRSLPMRGEWIEMRRSACRCWCAWRLSPCGESGLKFIPVRGPTR